jgi:hypothetical protein
VKGAGFYGAVAQVLPILMIVLLVELEIFRGPEGRWRTATLAVFFLAALAEIRALYALWSENRWAADYFLLTCPLAFLLGLMFALALLAPGRRHSLNKGGIDLQ